MTIVMQWKSVILLKSLLYFSLINVELDCDIFGAISSQTVFRMTLLMLLLGDNFITQIKSSCSIIYFFSIIDIIIVDFVDTTRNSLSQIIHVRSSLNIITITYKEFVVITQMFKRVLYIIESFINSETARFFTHNLRKFISKTSIVMAGSLTQFKMTHTLRKQYGGLYGCPIVVRLPKGRRRDCIAVHSPILFWKNVVNLKGNIFTTLHDILIASVKLKAY